MSYLDEPQAPDGLDLVIDFVNTRDIEKQTEALAARRDLARWLAERGLTRRSAAAPTAADLRNALALREALRDLMAQHNGAAATPGASAELERAARRGQLGVHFGDGGATTLAPAREGVPGALAALLVPVARAVSSGSWERVKACRDDGCHWAFFDHSRNRSGVWCDMAVCGNRTKVRAYRERTSGPAP